MFQSLSCPNCGAVTAHNQLIGSVVTCDYCRTSFRLPKTQTPQPDLGDLLLGADFSDPEVPGWVVVDRDKLTFDPGPPPELRVRQPATNLIHPVVRTPAPFDDFDASVTIRFLRGEYDQVSAGLELRSSDAGDYVIRISAQGTFSIGWHKGTDWGDHLVKWTTVPSLRKEWGDPNRLRVVMVGDRIRVYINGVLITSLRDDRYSSGLVRMVVSPGKNKTVEVAYSDLQLREVPR